ncbi:MAG: hypothetical protein JSS66_06210 [Armatimonadetes bacterium]|nr:hypothetical protein [Armatimonadota bacterium]
MRTHQTSSAEVDIRRFLDSSAFWGEFRGHTWTLAAWSAYGWYEPSVCIGNDHVDVDYAYKYDLLFHKLGPRPVSWLDEVCLG